MKTLAGLTIIFSAVGAVFILFAHDFIYRWLEQQPESQLQDKQLNEVEAENESIRKQKDQKPKLAA